MEPKAIKQDEVKCDSATWQRMQMEIEEQWHIAVQGEACDFVPSKLPISPRPIHRVA